MPIAFLLIVGTWLYGEKEVGSTLMQLRNRDAASLRVGSATMFSKLESLNSDLTFLASHSTTSVTVNQPSPENIAALADDFIKFSASKSIYDQIRWIDETGMERVRVDFLQGAPVLISDEQLQDKSKRYFFIETIKLKPGEIFTSPLDLNIEHDRIEEPFKPMLRIATPVTDQKDKNRGIVILNYLGNDLLQAFTQASEQTDAHNMLVNSEGYWLKSNNPIDEWGFMFKRSDLTLAARSPVAWQQIRNSEEGQLELEDGLWTWKTIYPLNLHRKTGTSSVNLSETYFWKVIAHDSADALNTIRQTIWLKLAGIVSLFLGLYGLGSWKLAKMWSAQAALKVKYRTVADFAYDWETWINPAGHYLYCSPSCARITGYSAQAFCKDPELLADIIHADDLRRVSALLQNHSNVEHVCQLAFRIVRSDGEIRWLEHVCQPVFDNKGTYIGRRASNRDITERKQIQANLCAAKDSLNDAQRIAQIGSWTFNLSNKELMWSDEIFRLFEIDPKQFAANYKAFLNAVHPEDRNAVHQAYTESLTKRASYEITHRLLMSDGRIKWVHERCTTHFDEIGNPFRFQGTVQDITERKRVEAELDQYRHHLEELVKQRTLALSIAKDAAEAANRAKSIFLANMGHELRTPLNAILGFSGMMQKNAQLEQTERDNLSIINRSGEHLLSVINDVLEMAKIETGRTQLEEVSFDLCDMVHDVTNMLSVRAKETGLQLFIDPSSQFPRFILADEGGLRQILINLLGNAIKFTLKGRVALRLGTKQNAHVYLFIEVEDTGPGIPPEYHQHIFEPFVQLGEHAISQGSGLGLTITRQFVQMMGGKLKLESSLGKGSLFRVELPLKEAREADVILKSAEQAKGEVISLLPGQPLYRILVVEDQLENRQLLTRLLESVGFRVKQAETGEQGVQLFRSWKPHLIWMDRRMPVMDGIEATKAIRELPGGKDVKVIAVTASAIIEQRDEMLEAGVDDFVFKPYRFNEIFECLARQLDVQFIYADTHTTAEVAIGPLTPEMLSVLSVELKRELRNALESLEVERIRTVIAQVTLYDAALYKTMSLLAENFDYPTILKALQVDSSDNEI